MTYHHCKLLTIPRVMCDSVEFVLAISHWNEDKENHRFHINKGNYWFYLSKATDLNILIISFYWLHADSLLSMGSWDTDQSPQIVILNTTVLLNIASS